MPPWTERLLTKIKKLYVVRLLLPSDGRQEPVVSARVYGFDSGRLRSRQQQQQQQQQHVLESSQSFSNSHSHSVPDSAKAVGSAPYLAPVATPATSRAIADAETSILMRSSDSADCRSSTESSGSGNRAAAAHSGGASAGHRRRATPRIRISDSSHMTDTDARALHQFIARHMRLRTRPQRRHQQPPLSASEVLDKPESAECLLLKSAAAEPNTDVSVPVSFAFLQSMPTPQPTQRPSGQPTGKTVIRRVVDDAVGGSPRQASEELMVALLLKDASTGRLEQPQQQKLSASARRSSPARRHPRSRATLKFAAPPSTMAKSKSSSSSERPSRAHRRPRRSPSADSRVTRTISFSVARDGGRRASVKARRGLEVKPRRQRRLLPEAASVEVPTRTTSSMTTTTSSTSAATTPDAVESRTATASESPSARRRRQKQRKPPQRPRQRGRLRGSRQVAMEPEAFQPTFSRIVEWTESTDSSR